MRSSDALPIHVCPLDSESDRMDVTVLGTEMLVKTKYSNLFFFSFSHSHPHKVLDSTYYTEVLSIYKSVQFRQKAGVLQEVKEMTKKKGWEEENVTQQAQLKRTQNRRL